MVAFEEDTEKWAEADGHAAVIREILEARRKDVDPKLLAAALARARAEVVEACSAKPTTTTTRSTTESTDHHHENEARRASYRPAAKTQNSARRGPRQREDRQQETVQHRGLADPSVHALIADYGADDDGADWAYRRPPTGPDQRLDRVEAAVEARLAALDEAASTSSSFAPARSERRRRRRRPEADVVVPNEEAAGPRAADADDNDLEEEEEENEEEDEDEDTGLFVAMSSHTLSRTTAELDRWSHWVVRVACASTFDRDAWRRYVAGETALYALTLRASRAARPRIVDEDSNPWLRAEPIDRLGDLVGAWRLYSRGALPEGVSRDEETTYSVPFSQPHRGGGLDPPDASLKRERDDRIRSGRLGRETIKFHADASPIVAERRPGVVVARGELFFHDGETILDLAVERFRRRLRHSLARTAAEASLISSSSQRGNDGGNNPGSLVGAFLSPGPGDDPRLFDMVDAARRTFSSRGWASSDGTEGRAWRRTRRRRRILPFPNLSAARFEEALFPRLLTWRAKKPPTSRFASMRPPSAAAAASTRREKRRREEEAEASFASKSNRVTRLPPCMARMYLVLRDVKHLKHDGRTQLAFFLNHVGLPFDAARELYRRALDDPSSAALRSRPWRTYEAHLKSAFGLTTSTKSYSSYGCPKLVASGAADRTAGRVHGCPFAFEDRARDLDELLRVMGVPPATANRLSSSQAKCTTPMERCAAAFRSIHLRYDDDDDDDDDVVKASRDEQDEKNTAADGATSPSARSRITAFSSPVDWTRLSFDLCPPSSCEW